MCRFVAHPRGFVAAPTIAGFTSDPRRKPSLPRHLTRSVAEVVVGHPCLSFGPSPTSKTSGSFTGFEATTTAAADSSLRRCRRRPFRREARSPQVRTSAFRARPSDLRHQPSATRASRSFGRSPWRVPPRIGFLFVGPRVRSPLPPDLRSRSGPCGSLRFLRPGPERTCTS